MKKEQGAVVDRRGNGIGTVSVTVYNTGTAVKPTIYSDNGITEQANPFTTDSMGRWAFYVANGRYDIQFSGSMISTYLLVDVLIEELGGANAVSIQGHVVNEAAVGNDRVLVYKTAGDQFVYEDKGAPSAHAASHQDGGGDEISVTGLAGQLGEKQDANKIQGHTVDETSVGNDKILVYKITGDKFVYEAKGTPAGHHVSHELGGGDQIDCTGLTGAGGAGGGGDFLVNQVFS